MTIAAEAYWMWNTAMCACALPLGGKLAGLPAPSPRALAPAALLGGAAAFGALLPSSGALGLIALPAAVMLCFHTHGWQACVRCSVTTLCASFLLGGAASALLQAGVRVGTAFALAMGIGLIGYLLITLLPAALCEVRQVELSVGGRSVLLPAMLDSGNLLRDPITGSGVLVIPRKAARVLFPNVPGLWDLESLPLGFRLLSVRTAAGTALLPMFQPEVCRLYINSRASDARVWVAVAGADYGGAQALVPMSALPQQRNDSLS